MDRGEERKPRLRKKLRYGITMGDIAGIGPELIIQAFKLNETREMFSPIVYGSVRALNQYRKELDVEKFSYNVIQEPNQAHNKKINIIECGPRIETFDIGKPSKETGEIAYESLKKAVEDLKSGEIDVLITLPIDKSTIQNKDFDFPGHTEYLQKVLGASGSLMLMASEKIKVAVVTGHIPLKDVAGKLRTQDIYDKIKIFSQSLKIDFDLEKPKIAVLGLNPHAGDNGLLGKEDDDIVRKAVEKASNDRMFVMGPFPADGFFGAATFLKFDGVLAMYHDQGLIPFKLLAGFSGVNFTAGLPFVRTSPDHGVAYDLAGRGVADVSSFLQALYLAGDIYETRSENIDLQDNALGKKKDVAKEVAQIEAEGEGNVDELSEDEN